MTDVIGFLFVYFCEYEDNSQPNCKNGGNILLDLLKTHCDLALLRATIIGQFFIIGSLIGNSLATEEAMRIDIHRLPDPILNLADELHHLYLF